MIARIFSGAIDGLDGYVVTVEVDVSRGLPGFHIVGLPNAAVRESRERVLSAVRNSGFRFPLGKVTVNLAPADVRKEGASFDLAIALGVVTAQEDGGAQDREGREGALLIGELSLSGELRPVRGLLAIVLDAAARGQDVVLVPADQAWEAGLVEGVRVVGVRNLAEAIAWWQQGREPGVPSAREPEESSAGGSMAGAGAAQASTAVAALQGLLGQAAAKRAAVLAAAGRHNLLLVGPPGTGKTRLARTIAALQPPLDASEALEVTRIHSAAGTLAGGHLLTRRPFRAPHHTVSRAGLIGGGSTIRPGEVTLAHQGILFLDELAEFAPSVLDALREPLEEGNVTVVRSAGSHVYPAAFQLIGAMNPCRCGFLGSLRKACHCSPAALQRYLNRLSGPFLDRFDLFVEMGEQACRMLVPAAPAEVNALPASTAAWQRTVGRIARTRSRLSGERARRSHGFADPRELLQEWSFETDAAAYLEEARRRLGLSLRGALRSARVARTIAMLENEDAVQVPHVAEALGYRRGILPNPRHLAADA